MRAPTIVLCVLALASGCTLLNRPDPSRLDAFVEDGDGGVDAGDGGDAGDAGVCPRFEQHEQSCRNGDDDDCDGLADCDDFDCGRDLFCCAAGGGPTSSDFDSTAYWTSLPIGATPVIAPSGGVVATFPSAEPRAIRYDECLPVDLGIELRAVMRARDAACAEGMPCPHASLVLTPLSNMARGVPLADELAIRVYGDGFVEARRAGAVIMRSPTSLGAGPLDVKVNLTPGLDDAGDAWVYAEVTVGSSSGEWRPWTGPRALIPRGDLVGAALGCEEARGLYLALEGVGDRVEIQSVTTDPYECANPSHFQPPPGGATEIDITDVGATERWSTGGIGAPALATYFLDDAVPETWTLLYDATNVPRTNELSAPVRFAIGLSQTTRADGIDDWAVRGDPLVGADPPQCAGCDSSAREPTVLLPIEEDRGLARSTRGWVVYARELAGSSGRHFALEARALITSPIDVGGTASELLTPESEGGDCTSLRDPLLLPIAPEHTDDAWLVYSCERSGTLREIRIARFGVGVDGPTATPMGVLLLATDVGPIARMTLRAADAATWFRDGRVIHRLWLATRDLTGRTAVAFAEASGDPDELPVFVPYAANPVLLADDPLFGDCSSSDCDIDSIAVARVANSPHRVRLLIARTIRTSTDVRHVLAPLDQIWPEPARP